MKKLLLFFLLNYSLLANAQSSAIEYLDFLIQQEVIVGSELVAITHNISDKNRVELTEQLQKLRSEADHAVERVEDKTTFAKSKYLKTAAIDYLAAFKHITKHELIDLVELITKPETETNDKGLVNDYFGKIFQHINKYELAYIAAKEKFCKEHNLEMPEGYHKFYLQETK